MLEAVIREIRKRLPDLELRENELMSCHCSFRIGGPARAMLLPKSREELLAACALRGEMGVKPFVMGNGTNLLVTDGALEKIVIKTAGALCGVSRQGREITAESGATLARVAVTAQQAALSGFEFAHGIPGSMGGAVSMNAGAYGGEIKDVLIQSEYLDSEGCLHTLTAPEHGLSYRRSVFSAHEDWVIVSSKILLTPGDGAEIQEKMRVLSEKRRASQPLDKPSAGSTFKRPATGYAAALIDQAGLKGFSVGGAQVSEKHAGFVINAGGASFDDVIRLMEHIKETVLRSSGVELEPEVKIITC